MAIGVDARIEGAEVLVRVAKAAKEAGDRQIRKDLLAGIRKGVKPVVEAIKEGAHLDLPGGLGDQYGTAKIAVRTRATGKNAGVRIQGPKKGKGADMGRVDETGEARHPVFANRAVWTPTSVSQGFAERAVERSADKAQAAVKNAMEDTLRRIAREV